MCFIRGFAFGYVLLTIGPSLHTWWSLSNVILEGMGVYVHV